MPSTASITAACKSGRRHTCRKPRSKTFVRGWQATASAARTEMTIRRLRNHLMRGEPELPYLRFYPNLNREEKLHQIKDLAKYSNFHHN
jgi:hypothetical protein